DPGSVLPPEDRAGGGAKIRLAPQVRAHKPGGRVEPAQGGDGRAAALRIEIHDRDPGPGGGKGERDGPSDASGSAADDDAAVLDPAQVRRQPAGMAGLRRPGGPPDAMGRGAAADCRPAARGRRDAIAFILETHPPIHRPIPSSGQALYSYS